MYEKKVLQPHKILTQIERASKVLKFLRQSDDCRIALRKPVRRTDVPARLKDCVGYKHENAKFLIYENYSPSFRGFIASLDSTSVPKTWENAMEDPKWKAAMQEEINKLKLHLAHQFKVKDLGQLRYFLGIEVSRSAKGIYLSQRKYILDLLVETGMSGCCPCPTPVEPNLRLVKEGGSPVDREQYQRLVGRLIYLSHTRPDIAFAVLSTNLCMTQRNNIWMRLS